MNRSKWRYETIEGLKAAVLAAGQVSDPFERSYKLRQLSIHNGVPLKALRQLLSWEHQQRIHSLADIINKQLDN